MSLTRKMLKEMGISDENIESIISAHTETIDAFRQYRLDSEKLRQLAPSLEELERLKAEANEGWKEKYSVLEKQFEDYKKEALQKNTLDRKEAVLRGLLTECGVAPECIGAIIRVSDLDALALSQDGKTAAEPEEVRSEIISKWQAFIPKTMTVGASIARPPKEQGGKTFTREDIKKMTPDEINRNYSKIMEDLRGQA